MLPLSVSAKWFGSKFLMSRLSDNLILRVLEKKKYVVININPFFFLFIQRRVQVPLSLN